MRILLSRSDPVFTVFKAINKFLYYADIEATTQRGKYKWLSEQSCSWQKKTDNSIKKLESLISLKKQALNMGSFVEAMDMAKNIIKSDYKLLYEKKRRLTFQYAIEQTLNEIVDNFAGDYVLTNGLPDGLEYQLGYEEEIELEYQPGYEEETVSLQQKDERYVESKTLSRANILYEKGNTIKLRNPTDTVFALYKDDSLSNITNLFSNGIKASIIDYKALPDKPVVYKIQIPLKDGSEYIGWVSESVISK